MRLIFAPLALLSWLVSSPAHATTNVLGSIPIPLIAGSGGTGITGPGATALTDASPIVVSAPAPYGSYYTVSLTTAIGATRQVGNPASLAIGQYLTFTFLEDSSGGEQVTWAADYVFNGPSTVNIAPNAKSTAFCVADTAATLQCQMAGGAATGGGLTLISTQTASSSASLQFTSLPTSYNTLFLNCTLVPSTTGTKASLQVGEGTGPTWETSGYKYGGYASGSGNFSTTFYSASDANILLGTSSIGASSGASVKVYIDNITNSSIYKNVTAQSTSVDGSGDVYTNIVSGVFTTNTNPITAIKVFMSSGNIASGTCSLYGMN